MAVRFACSGSGSLLLEAQAEVVVVAVAGVAVAEVAGAGVEILVRAAEAGPAAVVGAETTESVDVVVAAG
jgi:hypothetical protein